MSPILAEQLRSIGEQSFFLFLTALGVYLLTRILKLRNEGWIFPNARSAALPALALVAAWTVLLILVVVTFSRPTSAPPAVPSEPRYDLGRTLNQAVVYLIFVGPALVIMWRRREPLASSGVSRHNLLGAFVVGIAIAGVSILTSGDAPLLARGLTANQLWAFPYFAVVGFGEEFLFRGYLQTRLIAWLGRWPGWLFASILMAMMHIGQRVAVQGLASPEAVVSSALLIPISLFMGYVMLRTSNIVAPGICHTFANWVGVLG